MTKRQVAAARRAAFADAPYRVVIGSTIRTFAVEESARLYADETGGTAYAGTSRQMADGTARRLDDAS